jgi:glycosyltransferase involved in cell wall biosynthesis
MKLAVVVAQFPRLSETFILRELEGLRELGFEVTVYSLSAPSPTEAELVGDHGFEVVRRAPWPTVPAAARGLGALRDLLDLFVSGEGAVSAERLSDLRHVTTALRWARDMAQRGIGWVHGHFAYVPSMVALMCARVLDVPFSFEAHAWDLWCTRDDALLAKLLEEARFAAVCTEYGRDHLLARTDPGLTGKIHRIYHGLELAAYPFSDREPSDRLKLVAVGRLVEKKGFGTLLGACRRLLDEEPALDLQCEIIGEGPLRAELERRVASLALSERVSLTGALPHASVIERLRGAGICVVPSVIAQDGDRDGLPNVIMEAGALGVPLVASAVAAIPEFIQDRVTGRLVPQRDPAALAEAILETWRQPERAATRAQAARRSVEERFDLRANVRQLAALFADEPEGRS